MSVPAQLPPIEHVHELPENQQVAILDVLFEPSAPLHQSCLPIVKRPSESWHSLIYSGVGNVFRQLHDKIRSTPDAEANDSRETLDVILGSHPRLGAKKVESAASTSEQAHLQSSSEEETERLAELNAEYETVFPTLRFVVFVNGRPRSEIMRLMRDRIDRGDVQKERQESIQAMLDIAWDRAKKMGAAS